MRRLRPALIALLYAAFFIGNALGQSGSTQIYTQGRAALLNASTDERQSPATSTTEVSPAFPSLQPRSSQAASGRDGSSDTKAGSSKIAAPTITVASSLAVVLGLFAALVWGSRKFGNGAIHKGSIPKEIMQPLGSTSLDPRTRVTLLRCGNRILVLAQTSGTTQTLCEITDPEEVRALSAACLGDSKHDFASALRSIEREKASVDYAGSEPTHTATPTRRRLFASV